MRFAPNHLFDSLHCSVLTNKCLCTLSIPTNVTQHYDYAVKTTDLDSLTFNIRVYTFSHQSVPHPIENIIGHPGTAHGA